MGRRSGLANVVGSEKKNEDGNTVLQVRTPEIDDVTADHHRECDGIKFRIGKLWNITKSQDPWLLVKFQSLLIRKFQSLLIIPEFTEYSRVY